MNYLVLNFKKIKSKEEFKNVIAGHNFRTREYKNRENIDTTRTKDNIILSPLKFKNENELLKYTKGKLKENKRQIRKNSAKAFSLVVDCSVMEGWEDDNYIEYLKEANEWLNNYFSKKYGLINLGSIIHLDESKPHLHISFSYFSEIEGAWIQKQLYKKKVTNFNILLEKFEQEVGVKYELRKGENEDIKKQIYVDEQKIISSRIENYTIKMDMFNTKEVKAMSEDNINECLTEYKTKIIQQINQKVPEMGENERLKNELIKIKEKAKEEAEEELKEEHQQEIKRLEQEGIKLIEKFYEEATKEKNELEQKIQELQAKIKEQEDLLNKAAAIIQKRDNLIEEEREEYKTHIEDIQNRLKNKLKLDNDTIKNITKFEEDYFINQNHNRGIKSQTNTLTR